jgi:hypothetical protein
MELLKFIYLIISAALLLISGALILNRAFKSNIWLGVGCILLPVIGLIFVIRKWKETKYEAIFFFLGLLLYGGIFYLNRKEMDTVISKIRIKKVTLTTSINKGNDPVNDLDSISINEKGAIVYIDMLIPTWKYYKCRGKFLNPQGSVIYDDHLLILPKQRGWCVWFTHYFNKKTDLTGKWKFLFTINGKFMASKQFEVNSDSVIVNKQ